MITKFFALAALIAVAVLLTPFFALAGTEEAVSAGGFFSVLLPYLVEVAAIFISIVVGWLVAKISKLTGLQIEAKHREALQTALQNAANYGLNSLGAKADRITFKVQNELIATALNYIQKSSPDAIAYFGLSPVRLREMILSKIPPEHKAAGND